MRLYPTFKEWKQEKNKDLELENEVYILPLRNENEDTIKTYLPSANLVYILPLRNENTQYKYNNIEVSMFIFYL